MLSRASRFLACFGLGLLLAVSVQGRPLADSSLSPAAVAVTLRYGPPSRDSVSALRDRWLARDKVFHVAFSGLGTLSAQYVLVQKGGWRERKALPVAVATAVGAGAVKEVIDASRPTGTASARDLIADAAGVGLAVGIILL